MISIKQDLLSSLVSSRYVSITRLGSVLDTTALGIPLRQLVLAPINNNCTSSSGCKYLTDLHYCGPINKHLQKEKPDIVRYYEVSFGSIPTEDFFSTGTYMPFRSLGKHSPQIGMINNCSYIDPPSTPISQDIDEDTICNKTHLSLTCRKSEMCVCTHIESVPLNKVVELVFYSPDAAGSPINHPMHHHGVSYQVRGMGTFDDDFVVNEHNVRKLHECGKMYSNKSGKYPLMDTVPLFAHGYLVYRIYTDNPDNELSDNAAIFDLEVGLTSGSNKPTSESKEGGDRVFGWGCYSPNIWVSNLPPIMSIRMGAPVPGWPVPEDDLNLRTPDQDSNHDFPVIGSQIYKESIALDNEATEVNLISNIGQVSQRWFNDVATSSVLPNTAPLGVAESEEIWQQLTERKMPYYFFGDIRILETIWLRPASVEQLTNAVVLRSTVDHGEIKYVQSFVVQRREIKDLQACMDNKLHRSKAPVLHILVYCESSALDHVATNAVNLFCSQNY
uniref:Plastocyanin-like domain-containing protein n=1 Tax=Timema bartmani TaxID=61472 RepID=A0A7R9HXT1_9NEOP|nr:unnamed protein product [Timema bartmani]